MGIIFTAVTTRSRWTVEHSGRLWEPCRPAYINVAQTATIPNAVAFRSTTNCVMFNTGELSDQSNRELNVSKLLTAMANLRMDFGLTADDVLEISDRDGVLLALHLFQVMGIE